MCRETHLSVARTHVKTRHFKPHGDFPWLDVHVTECVRMNVFATVKESMFALTGGAAVKHPSVLEAGVIGARFSPPPSRIPQPL